MYNDTERYYRLSERLAAVVHGVGKDAEPAYSYGRYWHGYLVLLKPLLLLSSLQTRSDLVSERIRFLSVCDREKGSQYCETLYHYLSSGRSLKETCAALFTHRNTILYRIRKMRDEYGVPLDDPSAHLELLLGVSLALFRTKGADFFLA